MSSSTFYSPSGPASEPFRALKELASLARALSRHLHIVSETAEDVWGRTRQEVLAKLTATAENLGSYGVILDAPFVSDLMKNALRELVDPPGSGLTIASEPVVSFRRRLYALHPAAAVTAWLDATGVPWPSRDLPDGHSLEAALALLRWVRDREKGLQEVPEEIREDIGDLPAVLENQERKARDAGAPRSWVVYSRNHPEILGELRALVRSPLPGTKALASQILRILSSKPSS